MVKDHTDSERGNPVPPHGLLFLINSKGSFICILCVCLYIYIYIHVYIYIYIYIYIYDLPASDSLLYE